MPYDRGVLRNRRKFVIAAVGWPLCVLLVLVASGLMALNLYFVVSLVGFLIITELTTPATVSLAWRRRLRAFIVVGVLGFVYILFHRALLALPPDALEQLLG